MPQIAVKMPVLGKKPPQMPKNCPKLCPKINLGRFFEIWGGIWGGKCRQFFGTQNIYMKESYDIFEMSVYLWCY